jgi:hypothetical protein
VQPYGAGISEASRPALGTQLLSTLAAKVKNLLCR